jgi:probable phosphoglycerate mutase
MGNTIYLIRHGESHHNKYTMHLVGGHQEDSPLTELGEKQAEALGKRLQTEGIAFDRIYASTMKRASSTADIACKQQGIPLERIIRTDRIVELNHGNVNGRLRSEIYTPELKKYLDENSWEFKMEGGESQRGVADRMYSVVEEILSENIPTAAIFTHGTATKCLLRKILEFNPKHIYRTYIDNTSITELKYDNEGWHLVRLNDINHLRNL